jgi:hypothetical protein
MIYIKGEPSDTPMTVTIGPDPSMPVGGEGVFSAAKTVFWGSDVIRRRQSLNQ